MRLSIIIPVYNSEKILETLLEAIKISVSEKISPFEVILVNDCSLDQSWKKIKELKIKYNFLKGINLKHNYGQHSAIFCGLKHSNGEYIVCMDDDMQHDPIYIPEMINKLKEFEVCYVKFRKREHGFIKVLISKLNNIVSSFLMNKSSNIYTSSYKCFKKDIAKKIITNEDNFVFLDYWIFKYANKINYINIAHKVSISFRPYVVIPSYLFL